MLLKDAEKCCRHYVRIKDCWMIKHLFINQKPASACFGINSKCEFTPLCERAVCCDAFKYLVAIARGKNCQSYWVEDILVSCAADTWAQTYGKVNQVDSTWFYLHWTPIPSPCQSCCNSKYATQFPGDALTCAFTNALQGGNVLVQRLLANMAMAITLKQGDAAAPCILYITHPKTFKAGSAWADLLSILVRNTSPRCSGIQLSHSHFPEWRNTLDLTQVASNVLPEQFVPSNWGMKQDSF